MNIITEKVNRYCFQCGGCINQCPENAISYKKNNDLSIKVYIDKKLCSNCSKCLTICPAFQSLTDSNYFSHKITGDYKKLYIGYTNNQQLRKKAPSGGIVSEILYYLLKNRLVDEVICSRLTISNKKVIPVSEIITNPEDVKKFSGSIYMPTKPNDLLTKKLLNSKKKLAFVGLPCHIQNLNLLRKGNPDLKEKIISIGLFCGRNATKMLFYYILSKLCVKERDIKNFSFRSEGWPGEIIINNQQFDRDKYFLIPWLNMWFHQNGCHFCQDVFSDFSDISVGDAWLQDQLREKSLGYSAIIARSNIGNKILEMMTKEKILSTKPLSEEKLIESQIFQVFKKIKTMPYKIKKISKLKNLISRVQNDEITLLEKIKCRIILFLDTSSTFPVLNVFLKLVPLSVWKKLQDGIR